MSRWKAFGIHLLISSVILLVLLAIIMWVWFPGILFSVDGGWAGLRIVIGVDLVLGPLLTLVVFNTSKPELKYDLAAIAVFQFACMAAGMWIVYSERPLALVLAHDTVYSLATQEFEDFEKDLAILEAFPGSFPKLIYIEMPEDEVAADIAAVRSQFIGDPLYIQTDLYRALPGSDIASVFRRDSSIRNGVSTQLLDQLPDNCYFSKFISAVTSGYVCFDSDKIEYVSYYPEEYTRRAAAESSIDAGSTDIGSIDIENVEANSADAGEMDTAIADQEAAG